MPGSDMSETSAEDVVIAFGHPEREPLEISFTHTDLERWRRTPASEDWLQPRVLIRSGGFDGKVYPYLQATDFKRFLTELRVLWTELRGKATFTTLENQLHFSLSGDGRGHIHLRGRLVDRLGEGNCLEFSISYDQTFLGASIAAIEKLLSATVDAKARFRNP
jgi:hypothetical protein